MIWMVCIFTKVDDKDRMTEKVRQSFSFGWLYFFLGLRYASIDNDSDLLQLWDLDLILEVNRRQLQLSAFNWHD